MTKVEMELHGFATNLVSELGETLCHIGFLALGVTSRVWRLETDKNHYALRVIEADERVLSGDVDGFLRQTVIARGGRVVAPVLCSESLGRSLSGKRWCLEMLAEGGHPARGAVPDPVC